MILAGNGFWSLAAESEFMCLLLRGYIVGGTASILSLIVSRAGKSSCIKTIFQDTQVKDVAYFGVTQKVEKIDYESVGPISSCWHFADTI